MECSLHHNFSIVRVIFTLRTFGCGFLSHFDAIFLCIRARALTQFDRLYFFSAIEWVYSSRWLLLLLLLLLPLFCSSNFNFLPELCLLKGEHYYLTYYGLWLICFMRFMSANNTLNCRMFHLRTIDRSICCRANDKNEPNTLFGCCFGQRCLWVFFALFFFSLSHYFACKPSQSSNFTFYKGTATIFVFFFRFCFSAVLNSSVS